MLDAFKKFAFKGNVLDMAVGIIIGAGFSTMVKSLVDNVVMPPLGFLMGGVDFSDKKITLKPEIVEDGEVVTEAVMIKYGQFINDSISFVLVAFVLFIIVKKFIAALDKQEEEPAKAPEPSEDILLLREIRDEMKKG